jgi:hypothetical protein
MSATLSAEIVALLNDPAITKVLATTDGDGRPHAVVRNALHVGADGHLHLPELLETSATGRNLLGSLWYARKVAIALQGSDGRSIEIHGRPVKTHVTGPLFQQHYARVRNELGDVGLAAVWVIEPESIRDEDFTTRKVRQDTERPTLTHLDRLLKPAEGRA